MLLLAGADVVTPDAVVASQTIVVEQGRIKAIRPRRADDTRRQDAMVKLVEGHLVLPGFIDVHVHGVAGVDTLDGGDAIARIAATLPRFGVTAFCPTTMACEPGDLRSVLEQVRRGREHRDGGAARVLPAHLESNFINPRFRGAQPIACLRTAGHFEATDILREIERGSADIGIVTLAPEIEGGAGLIRWLRERGIRVSLGHSGATLEEAEAAIATGASQATHLFNCMPAFHHRAPGLAGAVLRNPDVVAELVCDGVHVHPAVMQMAIAAKTPARIMAITDGTAAAALSDGAAARIGGRSIFVREGAARLEDGTLAGSVLTMDGAFRTLTGAAGCSAVAAAQMCSTTPARTLGLDGCGLIAEGAVADLVVLDSGGAVVQTYVEGRLVYSRDTAAANNFAADAV